MSQTFLLNNLAELLLDDSAAVKEQVQKTCLSTHDKERDFLFDQMIITFKNTFETKPKQCSYIIETLKKMDIQIPLSPNSIEKFLKLLLLDVFPRLSTVKFNSESEEPSKTQDFQSLIQACYQIGQICVYSIDGLNLLLKILFADLSQNLLNNLYALKFFHFCISIPSLQGSQLKSLLKTYYSQFIELFKSVLTNQNDHQINEGIILTLNQLLLILSATFQEEFETPLNQLLELIYGQMTEDDPSSLKANVFDLSITSFKLISNESFISNVNSISQLLFNYLLTDQKDNKSALILLSLYQKCLSKSSKRILDVLSDDNIVKIAKSLLNFLSVNSNFSEIATKKHFSSFLLLAAYLEKKKTNSVLEPSINLIKDLKTTYQTSNPSILLVINKLVESHLISSNDQISQICRILNELSTASKSIDSIELKIFMFKLWTTLTLNQLVTPPLTTSDIFNVISSPSVSSAVVSSEFQSTIFDDEVQLTDRKIINPTPTTQLNKDEIYALDILDALISQLSSMSTMVPDLFTVALNPKYILASPIAFTLLNKYQREPEVKSETELNNTLIPQAIVYASSTLFTAKTRAEIISVLSHLLFNVKQSGAEAASLIKRKNCRFCTQKIVNKFILEAIETNPEQVQIPPIWIKGTLKLLETFDKNPPVEATKNDIASISPYIKSAVYKVLALLFTLIKNTIGARTPETTTPTPNSTEKPLTLSSMFLPLSTKCDLSNPIESEALADALVTIHSYNKNFATDVYKAKTETRKFGLHDQAHVFILEFCSQMLSFDGKYETKFNDTLNDHTISDDIRSHCFRRLVKNAKQPPSNKQANLLLNQFLESRDSSTIKASISAFLMLIKKKQITNYEDVLSKVADIFLNHENLRPIAIEIFHNTPIDLNFTNFATKIVGANSIEASKFITQLIIEKKEHNEPNFPMVLKKPQTATSISLMLLNKEFEEYGKKLAEIIFNFRNAAEEFPLTYYCSSDQATSLEFVMTLINCLHFYDPWNSVVLQVLNILTKDPRFEKVINESTDEFLKVIPNIPKASIVDVSMQFGKVLFEKNKTAFTTKLIEERPFQNQNVYVFLDQMIDDVGQTIFALAMKKKIQYPLYTNILKIIQKCKLPDKIKVSAIVFIIFTISQILTEAANNSRLNKPAADTVIALFDESVKSLDHLSSRFPLIDSQHVQKSLSDAKDTLLNTNNEIKIGDRDDEEKLFNFIRSLFSVCSNDILMFHITFFLELSPVGAIAGYAEIIHQGRPLITELLSLAQKAPIAALLAIPTFTVLTVDRYSESQIGELFDFVLDSLLTVPGKSFNCILALYDWLPKNILYEKCGKMFINTYKAMKKIGYPPISPSVTNSNDVTETSQQIARKNSLLASTSSPTRPQSQSKVELPKLTVDSYMPKINPNDIINGLRCITKFADSLTYSSNQDFKSSIPNYLVIAYCYSSVTGSTWDSMNHSAPFIAATARKALKTVTQFASMPKTAQLIQQNFTLDDTDGSNRFLLAITESFVNEMDLRCIDSALTFLSDEQRIIDVKISVAYLLSGILHLKKAPERNIQLRFGSFLLMAKDEKLKCGILKAIKAFPPLL